MVYDTNVTASAVAGVVVGRQKSATIRCVELAHDGTVRLAGSAVLRGELLRVLQEPEFGFDADDARRHVDVVYRGARDVRVSRSARLLARDPDDNVVLDCALAASAHFLVTKNLKDYSELVRGGRGRGLQEFRYRGIVVLSPSRFLAALRGQGRL